MLYERTGRTELAIQEFRILSQRNPELAENYFIDLGIGARKAKEFENAEKFFLRAVDINPQFSRSYAELGTNSYLGGDYDKSMEYFRKALALEPQRPEYHHYLGMALEKSGLQEEARESFQRSAELGGPPETRVSLAKMYLSSGEVSRAIDELNLVLEESPSDEEAKVLLVRAMDRAESEQKRSEERAEFATHRLTRLESIIEDLTRSNRNLESRALSLQMENQEMDRELEELKGQAGGLSREKEETEEALNELRQERAAQGQELDGLRDQLTVLRSEKDSWNEELEGLKELVGRLSGEKAQVGEEMARLREELAVTRSGKDSRGAELSAARAQAEEVRSASKQLQTRLTVLEQESYRRIEEARGKAAVELGALGKELEASRKREQEALLGQERLQESLRSMERVREELEKVRWELGEQSLELGGMYMKNRSWDKAAAAFQRVLEVDPGNAQVYYSLGEIYFQLGRFDLSKDMYRKAKEIF
jgi:tetratricopeptide (TPR) repeat protein